MIKISLPNKSFIEIHENFIDLPFERLKNELVWKTQHLNIQGRLIPFPRLNTYYGSNSYKYSGIINQPVEIPELLKPAFIKLNSLGYNCNSVLCNFYRDGRDSISWHADDEHEMPKDHCISSLSFGCERTFKIKSKEKGSELFAFTLKNQDLFIMGGQFQQHYLHSIPKEDNKAERINLTFRQIG